MTNLYTRFGCPDENTSADVVEGLLTHPAEAAEIAHLDSVALEAVTVELRVGVSDPIGGRVCAGYRTTDKTWHWPTTVVELNPTSNGARIPVVAANVDVLAIWPNNLTVISARVEAR